MIAKYTAKCRYCKTSIEVGRDTYDVDSKTSYHNACHEKEEPPGPEQFATADRLGFVSYEEAVAVDWQMRCLPAAHRESAAGRPVTSSHGRQSDLQ